MMKKIAFAIVCIFITAMLHAQTLTVQQYIDTYKDIAIAEMKRSGIPASITLAQGILETESGNSDLVKKSNNHFGIKCKSSWTGESVTHTDDAPNECFRKYSSAWDSYKDHSDYLKNTSRYASLFQLGATDYKGWAYGLKRAGYATNPRYPEILINNIERYNLQQYNDVSNTNAITFEAGKLVDEKKKEKIIVFLFSKIQRLQVIFDGPLIISLPKEQISHVIQRIGKLLPTFQAELPGLRIIFQGLLVKLQVTVQITQVVHRADDLLKSHTRPSTNWAINKRSSAR